MIREILEDLGFKPQASGSQWMRMEALYRNGNSLSLAVNQETGWFEDFVTGQNGPFFKLVMLTLGIGEEEARSYLSGSYFESQKQKKEEAVEKIDQQKFLPIEFLDDLLPSFSFYKRRGIDESVLKEFGGGVKTYGKMNNRFVFPIYDFNNKLIGVTGRDLFAISTRSKWKIIGRKNKFIYPYHLTQKHIEDTGEVILVESVGDGLSLYNAGIKNFLVTFGLNISKDMIMYLIRINLKKIIIATNNDLTSVQNRGLAAAHNIRFKLLKYFPEEQVVIKLPPEKDFGDMDKSKIIEWHKNTL